MGDPKKRRKNYSTPTHPWDGTRIEEERDITNEYGVKNKKEIHKMNSFLKRFSDDAKKLVALRTEQAEKEKQEMLHKLQSLGLLPATAQLADVLGLKLKDVMERRLQTQVLTRGMSRSVNQARQFITHRHITVGGKIITQPSYLITKEEEPTIGFVTSSSLSNPEHPERKTEEKEEEKKPEKREKKSGRKGKRENNKAENKKSYHKKAENKNANSEKSAKKEKPKEEKKQENKEEKSE